MQKEHINMTLKLAFVSAATGKLTQLRKKKIFYSSLYKPKPIRSVFFFFSH